MEKQELYKIGLDMLYLASCALHGRIPERARVEQMKLSNVFKMSKIHSMQAIAYISVSKCVEVYGEDIIDAELYKRWRIAYHDVLNRLVRFDIEREALLNFLEEKGIWYLCLKGVVLQNYYPALGMRQMGDNDILIDADGCKVVRKYFSNRGYNEISYGTGCHDSYSKGTVCFEIHRELFSVSQKRRYGFNYYSDVKSRLIKGDRQCELLFSDDDFYVYFISHAEKHFASAGCGVRTLMDIFVYLSKKDGELDEKYIAKELCALGITDYERSARELAFKVFTPDALDHGQLDEKLDEGERELLAYYVLSGTFGTIENMVENSMADITDGKPVTRGAKIKYVLRRIFPDRNFYRDNYPKAGKYLIAIPFLWALRLFRAPSRMKRYAEEIDKLKEIE